ncbi:fimbrial protein [Escherichia coli]|uniref:fimbrial protein n=1 Tax=Escherichia coli TaxID=562 RepID=UPI00191A755D|nr:type 1 fimbrial protein [Escherichia coli]CAD6106219.1 P pilus assembly protein, pilin FimA [Escherichia coli]CAD6110301.1 P pilus assembly protein, pilin FimA [Escherichia coli]CAD6180691.1 P pilus assembly protein, pilin FimA [Escherichia coli]
MKLIYMLNRFKSLAGFFFVMFPVSALAAGTKSYNTTVTVDIPQPTCSISVPSDVHLGTLTPGMKISWLPDVSITVDCAGSSIKHAVYMMSANVLSSGNDGIFLKQNNSNTGILLKLEGENGSSKFTANEQSPYYIHEGTTGKTYKTKLSVDVPDNAKAGSVSGVVVFKLTYPA